MTLPVTNPRKRQKGCVKFYVTSTHKQLLLGVEACKEFDLLRVIVDAICSLRAEKNDSKWTDKSADVLERLLFKLIQRFPHSNAFKKDANSYSDKSQE